MTSTPTPESIDILGIPAMNKLKDVFISWSPNEPEYCDDLEIRGKVSIETVEEFHKNRHPYGHLSVCGPQPWMEEGDVGQNVAWVLGMALKMIIRDKLDPQVVNLAMMQIEEYAFALPYDMPGLPREAQRKQRPDLYLVKSDA